MAMKINSNDAAKQFAQALAGGDQAEIQAAWDASMKAIAEKVKADYEELKDSNDKAVLAQRGYRELTAAETKFYSKLADAMKSPNPKQAFIDIQESDGDDAFMPETIIADVFKHLPDEHPLLAKVKLQYSGYSTKLILDDSSVQKAVWGKVTAAITEEIEGALTVKDFGANKLSAFVIIPMAIIDLGPTWIDSYVRTLLTDAYSTALEDAIVNGTGVNQPTGVTKDPDGSFDASTGYPDLAKVKVTDFSPKAYGPLVAKMAKTAKGRARKLGTVQLLCNTSDYLTKIMPATTLLCDDGHYATNLFPYPTEVIQTNAVADGTAVLCHLESYAMSAATNKNGAIEFDDSVKFFEHARAFRSVGYFDGRMEDNTCAVVLDISKLDPAYVTVKSETAAQASA